MTRGNYNSAWPNGYPPSGSCRFCREYALHSDMVKYGERHWAHPVCLYKRKGIEAIDALPTWMIGKLPTVLMMEAGVSIEKVREWSRRLDAEAKRIDAEAKARAARNKDPR